MLTYWKILYSHSFIVVIVVWGCKHKEIQIKFPILRLYFKDFYFSTLKNFTQAERNWRFNPIDDL
jgi:hypothetical protein